MEVEAKFLVPDEETLARLIEVESLAGCSVEPGEARHDADTFLDTAGRRLLTAGFYFRRRETSDGVRLTLKKLVAPSEGVLRREEIESLVAADVPVTEWPAGPLRERVEELTGGELLEPLLTLAQTRVARVVRRGRRRSRSSASTASPPARPTATAAGSRPRSRRAGRAATPTSPPSRPRSATSGA